jgi:anionic cell wall polymer biosynthesis LytR-Cps2A-Psr (LCP) family protein
MLIFVILVGSGLFFYFQVRTDRITAMLSEGESFSVHFMIGDADALLYSEVFLYNPRTGKGAVVDIPGNVGTIIESLKRVDRIDALFTPDNPAPYRKMIGNFVGLEVPFYCLFTLDDIERFVDVLGGVEVFIANSIETDARGNKVLLPSGNVLLDGSKTRIFLSYYDPEETELDRIGRAQKFLQGMLKKLGENAQYLTHDDVMPFLRGAVDTNLDGRALAALVREIVKLDVDRMVFQRVLGTIRTVDTQDLLFPHFEGQLLRQTVKQIYEGLASTDVRGAGDLAVSLEILNGTKTAGLARRTREIFQSFGFEVVSFSNAEEQDMEKTVVIDRRGNPETAGKVAQVIRCARIVTEIPEDAARAPADVTLVLGRDFDGRYCK